MTTTIVRRADRPTDPPIAAADEPGGGGSQWAELTRVPNDIEAHLLAGRLSEAGIDSCFLKDRSYPGAWMYGSSHPWAPSTVMVRRFDLPDARIVLAEISYAAPAATTSVREAAAMSRRSTLAWWAAALVLGTLLSGIALARAADALQDCPRPCAVEPQP